MWTAENRGRYDRSRLRYPSDLTDAEWSLTKPLIPRAKRGGNKRTVNVREIVNGPWCLTFGWEGQDAIAVDLENYH
jgi:transposase